MEAAVSLASHPCERPADQSHGNLKKTLGSVHSLLDGQCLRVLPSTTDPLLKISC
jgi:hypothetical protein